MRLFNDFRENTQIYEKYVNIFKLLDEIDTYRKNRLNQSDEPISRILFYNSLKQKLEKEFKEFHRKKCKCNVLKVQFAIIKKIIKKNIQDCFRDKFFFKLKYYLIITVLKI